MKAPGLQAWLWIVICCLLGAIGLVWGDPISGLRLPDDDQSPSVTAMVQTLQSTSQALHTTMDCSERADPYDDFAQRRHAALLGNSTVFVHKLCFSSFSIRSLAVYLNTLACAEIIGAHYLLVLKLPRKASSSWNELLSQLPQQVVHEHPLPWETSTQQMHSLCRCRRACWSDPHAPWSRALPTIREILHDALSGFFEKTQTLSTGTLLQADDSYTANKLAVGLLDSIDVQEVFFNLTSTISTEQRQLVDGRQFLPLIPSVTVSYHCSNKGFGVIPLSAFTKERVLKGMRETEVTTIFVLFDQNPANPGTPGNNPSTPTTSTTACNVIAAALFAHFTNMFPNAFVLLTSSSSSSSSSLIDFARMAQSKVTFCSASSLCLWAAIVNPNTVFLPFSAQLGGAVNSSVTPDLGKNKHWFPPRWVPLERMADELKTSAAARNSAQGMKRRHHARKP